MKWRVPVSMSESCLHHCRITVGAPVCMYVANGFKDVTEAVSLLCENETGDKIGMHQNDETLPMVLKISIEDK